MTESAFWRHLTSPFFCLPQLPWKWNKTKTPLVFSLSLSFYLSLCVCSSGREAMEACEGWSFSPASFVDRRSSKQVYDNVHGNIYLDSVCSRTVHLPPVNNFGFLCRMLFVGLAFLKIVSVIAVRWGGY